MEGSNYPGGCKNGDEFAEYLVEKIKECIVENKNKAETENHLLENFQIERQYTSIIWDRFRTHDAEELKYIEKKASEEVTLPGGYKTFEEFADYLVTKVNECEATGKSMSETMNHLFEQFNVDPAYTRACLLHLASPDNDLCRSLVTDLQKKHDMIEKERKSGAQATQVDLTDAGTSTGNREEQIETAKKSVQQETGPDQATQANVNKREAQVSSEVNATTKQPVSSSATEIVGLLKQILAKTETSSEQILTLPTNVAKSEALEIDGLLKQILAKTESSSEQIRERLTNAAKSEEKQPVEEEEVRGDKK